MTNWGAPRVVLVVEDDDSMRESIEELLGIAGFRTVVYGSAEAMLAEEAPRCPLCIVSDLNLPAMSGFDLLRELSRRSLRCPVIIITAYDSAGNRQEAAQLGASAFLVKPFPSQMLLTAIEGIAANVRPS
jgi:two-component system, LuxR family, response regulator FixJ